VALCGTRFRYPEEQCSGRLSAKVQHLANQVQQLVGCVQHLKKVGSAFKCTRVLCDSSSQRLQVFFAPNQRYIAMRPTSTIVATPTSARYTHTHAKLTWPLSTP
jgi:hypothetical protein